MTISEFIARTGFEPTADEYAKIEDAYYSFDGDKDAFCAAFVKDDLQKFCAARGAEIERLNRSAVEVYNKHEEELDALRHRIDELTAKLDKELEWKASPDTGTTWNRAAMKNLPNPAAS